MVRCSARGVTGGTLVEAGSGAGGCPRFACSTRSSVFAILVSVHCKNVRWSNEIWALAQAQTLVPMEVDALQAGIFPPPSDGLT